MTRTVKDPDVRRSEILSAAGELFGSRGYSNTSVDSITERAGIAKGTFYYYFESKADVLGALVHELVSQMVTKCRVVANDANMNAVEKIGRMLHTLSQAVNDANGDIMHNLHLPENRELHERSNVETILAFGPIMAEAVEQGNREGVFNVSNPLETVQFLLAGSQFIFDSGLFDWTAEEEKVRRKAMQSIIERSLGAEPGTFFFISGRNIRTNESE